MKKDRKSKGRRAASWSWSVDDDLRDEDTLNTAEADEEAPVERAEAPAEAESKADPDDRMPTRTGSRQKLCKLVKEEAFTDNMTAYMELVRKPEYVCRKCGRSAGDKGNLCRPVPLEFKYE